MKAILLIILTVYYFTASSQIDWRPILNKSLAYYVNKKSGIIEFSTAEKNVLKNDTNYYYSQQFLYLTDSKKIGKLFYRDDTGFSIYINTKTYYVYTDTRTYYIGENSSNDHLKFLPYWDPASFYFAYLEMGHKYGAGVELNENGGYYVLRFTNNNDGKFVLNIDSKKFNLISYTEVYTHKKFGDQYKKYTFDEKLESGSPDSILNDLDLVLQTYTRTTDEMIKNAAKGHEKVKRKLIGSKINKSELNRLLFDENSIATIKGSYILLDYFYQTCLPCIKAIPELNELRTKFDSSKLLIVGVDPVAADAGAGKMDKFIKRYNVLYPVVDGEQAVAVRNTSLPGLAVIYPTLVLIKPDGTIEKIMEAYSKSHFRDITEFLKKAF